MGDGAAVRDQIPLRDQLKNNLKAWNGTYWLVFFMIIPLVLLLILALPGTIKEHYFVFHSQNLLNLQTYILSSYTHSELYPHMAGNLVFYMIVMAAVFAFETNRRRFHLMAGISFFIVPLICSFLTIGLWHFFGTETSMQGFSGIDAAFLAYGFLTGVTFLLRDRLELFDHPELFTRSRLLFYVLNGMLAFVLGMVVFEGILIGQFASTGSAVSNGIAHFGGFVTGLTAFFLFDFVHEKRKNFDIMLGISILVGCLFYVDYLFKIVNMVRGI